MTTPLNLNPTAPTDGIRYAVDVPITATEAVLGNTSETQAHIPIIEGQTIVAVVKLFVHGVIVGNNSYVVMQTDLGTGDWIDVAWLVWTGGQGAATFVLCGGGLGAMNNAFAQGRAVGQFPQPQAVGSNACPIGGRVRFVGRATHVGGSSIAAGSVSLITASITYKLQHPR